MGPYRCSSASAADKGWTGGPLPGLEFDGILAGVGYRVRPSDLGHVAQTLERLESAMVGNGGEFGGAAVGPPGDAVHYNPSDLTAWVDSMLSELAPDLATGAAAQPSFPLPALPHPAAPDQMCPPLLGQPGTQISAVAAARRRMEEEEDTGIRLVHLLMSCAEAVQRGDAGLAGSLVEDMRPALARVSAASGIGKVASYFADALLRRLCYVEAAPPSAAEYEVLYHHFYEACPYLKFAHFTANQAILEAFDGHDRVHVIDFSLMQGHQWPALIQALALRPGGPPFLRLTGIGRPSPNGRDELREVGLRLAELARSVRVRFAFRGVAADRLDDVRPWMLQVARGEAVAVNSLLQLHGLLGDPDGSGAAAPIDSVLGWVVGLRPKIVTVVEQEADHNRPAFLDRFTEALFYYSTMFDSLEAGAAASGAQQRAAAAVAEAYLQREICNIVCCEGAARVERHEPLAQWRVRLGRAGLTPVHLGSNAYRQASMLLSLFSGEGFSVEEVDGCLTLGWHNRPLISASAWRGGGEDVAAAGKNNRGAGNPNSEGRNNSLNPMDDNHVNNKSVSTANDNDDNNYRRSVNSNGSPRRRQQGRGMFSM